MTFKPKSFQQIVADMAAEISARTPINDFSPNSVILTLLEAAAQEDFQQYNQMIELLRNYNLDTTEGADLDARAFEFGLRRQTARPHSGYVTIKDTRFTAIGSKLYAGLPGPSAGSTKLYVDNASAFTSTGSIYVGRGTANVEGPISYTAAPVDATAYWEITLDTALTRDHGTDETVILAQYGVRQINAGTEVRVPENDFSDEIIFELNQTVELADGADTLDNVLITAIIPSGESVPKGAIREFVNPPFTGATVYNNSPLINGRDEESDQQLRDRIRSTIQSLSRGTAVAVKNSILGIIDPASNSSITSANVITPTVLADGPTKVYIDNGRGLEPEVATYGLETLETSATGGEKYFQLEQFPLVKASILSQLTEPFNLVGGEFLTLKVGSETETFVFATTDFTNLGAATGAEVAQAINNRAVIFEARSTTDAVGTRILITPKATVNEDLSLEVESTANSAFNFTTRDVFTLKLYKNDKLLTKDGTTASVLSASDPFDLSSTEYTTDDDVTIASGSTLITKTGVADDFRVLVKVGDYVKSSADTDNFYTKVKMVVSNSKLILETKYPAGSSATSLSKLVIWSSPQIELSSNGDMFETEVVSFSKNDFVTPAQATAAEVLARVRKELNLSRAQLAVNNRKVNFQSYLENSAESMMSVSGGHGALALGFTYKYSLTGSVAVDGTTNVLTGTNTLFKSQLAEGRWFKMSGDGNGAWTKIIAIESDTIAYFEGAYNGATGNGLGEVIYPSTPSVGSNKDYTLNRSNGQIELVEPLVAGDTLTAGSINTRAFSDSLGQPFDFSSLGSFSTLIVRVDGGIGFTALVNDSIAPYLSITDSTMAGYPLGSFIGYHLECVSGNNVGAVASVANYDPLTGKIDTITGFANPIVVGDQFVLSQVMEFVNSTDFADEESATAVEVVSAINKKLIGASAQELSGGRVRLRTNNLNDGSIQVIGGSANSLLGFSTVAGENQESNLAFATSQRSDRYGLSAFPGFTLSPAQSLVVVVDNDNVNKTFATAMKIEAAVDSATSSSITSVALAAKYPIDGTFLDFWVYWKAGSANEGKLQVATGYIGSTGTVTLTSFFPVGGSTVTPVAGDVALLVPRTAENVVALLNDLNSTTLSIAADIVPVGNTGDYVQISTKLPGTRGKVHVRGGTANSLGIAIQGPVPGAPINDVYVNSIAGLFKGLPVYVTSLISNDILHISNIQGTTAPYTVSLVNANGAFFDATALSTSNEAKIGDLNGLQFDTTQLEGIDGYKFYKGLIQLAQWTIDGLDRDQANYPGIGAAGTQFEVLAPVLVRLKLAINITPAEGTSVSAISSSVSSKILEYVNSRKVGEDVILSEIISAAQSVVGVFDAKISNLTDNVTIADGELARLAASDLIVG